MWISFRKKDINFDFLTSQTEYVLLCGWLGSISFYLLFRFLFSSLRRASLGTENKTNCKLLVSLSHENCSYMPFVRSIIWQTQFVHFQGRHIHCDGKAKTKQIATVKMLTCLWLFGNGHPSFIQYGFFTISYAESAATELQCPICKSINILLPCILHILFVNVCTDFWNQIGNLFHSHLIFQNCAFSAFQTKKITTKWVKKATVINHIEWQKLPRIRFSIVLASCLPVQMFLFFLLFLGRLWLRRLKITAQHKKNERTSKHTHSFRVTNNM